MVQNKHMTKRTVMVAVGEICKVRNAALFATGTGYSFARVVRVNKNTARLAVLFKFADNVTVVFKELQKLKASTRTTVLRRLKATRFPRRKERTTNTDTVQDSQPVFNIEVFTATPDVDESDPPVDSGMERAPPEVAVESQSSVESKTITTSAVDKEKTHEGAAKSATTSALLDTSLTRPVPSSDASLLSGFLEPEYGITTPQWFFSYLCESSLVWSAVGDGDSVHSQLYKLVSPPYNGRVSYSQQEQDYEACVIQGGWIDRDSEEWSIIQHKLFVETGEFDLSHPETRRKVSSILITEYNCTASVVSRKIILGWSVSGPPLTEGLNVVSRCLVKKTNTVLMIAEDSILNFTGNAIVNAANEYCLTGGGIDAEVNKRGGNALFKAREELPFLEENIRCYTGDAKITIAGNLHCEHVIHAVGPRFPSYTSNEEALRVLEDTYKSAMSVARQNGMKMVAFCLISAGIFRGNCALYDVVKVAVTSLAKYSYPGLERLFLCAYTPEERMVLKTVLHHIVPH